jgi:uncharacterized phage-associated protein
MTAAAMTYLSATRFSDFIVKTIEESVTSSAERAAKDMGSTIEKLISETSVTISKVSSKSTDATKSDEDLSAALRNNTDIQAIALFKVDKSAAVLTRVATQSVPAGGDKRYIETAKYLETQEKIDYWDKLFEQQLLNFDKPNEYSGYKKTDFEKVSQIIAFFHEKIELFKTKLNKLLFYADFMMYQRTGRSITGIKYRAIPYGPVPAEYEKLFLRLQDQEKINIVEVGFENGNYGELIKSNQKVQIDGFSQTEMMVLEDVLNRFEGLTTKQIVDISHHESAWIENKDERKIISYQKYAFSLQALE